MIIQEKGIYLPGLNIHQQELQCMLGLQLHKPQGKQLLYP